MLLNHTTAWYAIGAIVVGLFLMWLSSFMRGRMRWVVFLPGYAVVMVCAVSCLFAPYSLVYSLMWVRDTSGYPQGFGFLCLQVGVVFGLFVGHFGPTAKKRREVLYDPSEMEWYDVDR